MYEHRNIWPLFFGKTVIYQCGCGTEASLVVKGKVCIRVPRRGKKYFYIFWLKRTEAPHERGVFSVLHHQKNRERGNDWSC